MLIAPPAARPEPPERRPLAWSVALALISSCTGLLLVCSSGQVDRDRERAGAVPIPTQGVQTDRLDAEREDRVDVKFLEVLQQGLLRLSVYWDNPRVTGRITLTDRFGVILSTVERNPRTQNDSLDRYLQPGLYYIELALERGASIYSLETVFLAGALDSLEEPVPYCIELMEGRPTPPDAPASDDPEEIAAAGEALHEEAADDADELDGGVAEADGGVVDVDGALSAADRGIGGPDRPLVLGLILRVVEVSPRQVELTLNRGSRDGVIQGARGRLIDAQGQPLPGGEFTVFQVFASTCKTELTANPERLVEGVQAQIEIIP